MSVFLPQVNIVLFGEFDETKLVLSKEKAESMHHLDDLFWSIFFN